ncbi:MAG: hypothetical protein J1E00_00330 [Oscillospiraceae bacterium]|nr:hypothetical protein [Oscillospiraceae bacterium]
MKRLKKFLSASKINVIAFILMVSLALVASIGAAHAAVGYLVQSTGVGVRMYEIGVSLLENGERVSWRDYVKETAQWDENHGVLLRNMLQDGKQVVVGQSYSEELSVRNSGAINEYVRVSIYKYWVDKKTGEKRLDLEPAYIDLHLLCDATGFNNGWHLDSASSTAERTVLLYDSLLYSEVELGGEGGGPSITQVFSDTLTIDPRVASDRHPITGEYLYKDVEFRIEISVNSVQEHNTSWEDVSWS